MSRMLEDITLATELEESVSQGGKKLFDRIGGRTTIEKVHKIFYDKIYADAWLGQFFAGIDQKHIESQQTDFIALLFGGPKAYSGRMPIDAHEHIMIGEEIFAARSELLRQSLHEAGIGTSEIDDWLRIDMAFKKVLIKNSLADCKKRFFTDVILDFPNPAKLNKAS
ncbi:MAG: group 1 truncated hemoglobin [Oligoflexales bacterium]|nr:group 1 truncated hemoglobin [Oligoflexales bacterium]